MWAGDRGSAQSWSGRAAHEDEGDGEDDETQDEERANRDKHALPSVRAQGSLASRAHVGVRGVAHGAVATRVSRRLGSELALARQVHRPVGAMAH
eukprot:scaffold39894_cov61-Phaeocystis_antarctica.AAC.3